MKMLLDFVEKWDLSNINLLLQSIILMRLSGVNQMEPLLSNLVKSQNNHRNDPEHPHNPTPTLSDHPQHISSHPTQVSKNSTQTPSPLTHHQLFTLRAQLLAYKHLVRNIALPEHENFGLEGSAWQEEKEKLRVKGVQTLREKTQKDLELRNMIFPGWRVSSREDSNQNDQTKYLLEKRKVEVDHMIERGDQITITPQTREKLELESRFIGCRDIYKNIFQRVTDAMKRQYRSLTAFQSTLLDRTFFRRERLVRGDTYSKNEKPSHFRNDSDKRKRMMHKECMQHLKLHREEFMEWHKKKIKERKKLVYHVKAQIESKRKEKEEIQEKKKVARLKELKAHNMEIYLELVEEEKKTKIKELLSQTNKFLKELGAKVLVQKGATQEQHLQELNEKDNLKDIFQSSNTVYYNLTHTIKEDISTQPSILEGGQLKRYQLNGLQWLVSLYNNNLNGILADQMGLGKTIQTIALLCYLIEFKKNFGPFLIVAPLSTIPNWMAEFQKWAPSIRKVVYKGNPNTRTETLRVMRSTKWNVCITTYDFILKDRLKLSKYDWKYIVIDEGHKMKNAKSKFSNILGQQYQSDHRLLLTGTPLQNNLGELWALLNFLLPKVFNSCDDFQKWFSMALYKNTGDQSVQLDQEEQLLIINRLHQVLRPFLLRRVKKEVYSELPDKKQHVIKVELSAWQKLIYENISQKTALEFASNSGKISKTTLTNLMMQLRKCCNHPYLFLKNYDDICYHQWIIRSSGKFELIDRILPKFKRFNHRVLIFTQMTHLMDIMQAYFDYRGVRHLRLDGSTKAEDRQERMKLFNEPNSQYDVFLLSTRAGGLGLNLQTADTVIIFDSDWNPQMDLQAQDRVHRIGQEKQVIVLRLITNNSIEQHILQRTAFKMNLNELFIQGGLYNLNSSEAERRKKIEDILLKTRKDNEDNEDEEILDDEMINQYIKRSDEEYEEFNKMDQERYNLEREYFQVNANDVKKHVNYRLMKETEIPSWFIETPKNPEANKEYGRGNRIRKQINYSDQAIDDQVLNITEFDDEEANNVENDYTPIEVPRARREQKIHRQQQQDVDIDKLIEKEKPIEEAFFEQE